MRTSKAFKGVLENAGLGEVAFYLKKAKQQLAYAEYALDNTNFSDALSRSKKIEVKIQLIRNTILELDEEIENLGLDLINELEKIDESEKEKRHGISANRNPGGPKYGGLRI